MLALATGWTEHVIGGDGPDGITDDFRRACHHALYARVVAADLAEAEDLARQAEAIDLTTIPTARRSAVRKIRAEAAAQAAAVRARLGLTDG